MKNHKFTLAICLLFYMAASFAEKSVPEFYILKSEKDKSLKSSEALFEFNLNILTNDPNSTDIVGQTIKFSYNGKEETRKIDSSKKISLKVKPGKYLFKFFLTKDYYEITSDSVLINPNYKSEAKINFTSSVFPIEVDKPVIYLYSPTTIQALVKLENAGQIDFTYPLYNDGWNVTVNSTGGITTNNKKYNYLFWEGKTNINTNDINLSSGFVVTKNNLVSFFEEKLSQMGLNNNEIEDYITYWAPIMNKNENNYVHFMFKDEFNKYSNLSVTPKPNNLFRVFMVWSKADGSEKVQDQEIQSLNRNGFTVVEWGGGELNLQRENQ